MNKWLAFISLSCLVALILACSSSKPSYTDTRTPSVKRTTEHYTSTYPRREISTQLRNAQKSILRIITTNFYNTYSFEEKYVTLADINTNDPRDIATDFFSTEESAAGTSILLQQVRDKILLITCEHVVSSPDTVVSYYEGEEIPENTFVKTISIKRKQNNLLFSRHRLFNFEIIATDNRTDLALLTASITDEDNLYQHPLNFTMGDSDKLQMGSMLYVLGFPRGYPLVTRGMASISEFRNPFFFITDALFNPGVSGGLVLASKDNYQNFQWVGMARSATASKEELLVPSPAVDDYGRAAKPYFDTPYVQQKTRISYGITQTIPINTIKDFIAEHQSQISRNGFRYGQRLSVSN